MGRIGLLVVLVVVAGLYVEHTLAYLSTRVQAEQEKAVVQRLARENAQLVREESLLARPAMIESDARRLGMAKAGERSYVVTDLPDH